MFLMHSYHIKMRNYFVGSKSTLLKIVSTESNNKHFNEYQLTWLMAVVMNLPLIVIKFNYV